MFISLYIHIVLNLFFYIHVTLLFSYYRIFISKSYYHICTLLHSHLIIYSYHYIFILVIFIFIYSNYHIFINSYHHILKLKSYYHIFILYSCDIIFMSYYIHSVLLHGLNNALHSIASHDIEVQQVLLLIVLFPEPLSHQRFRPLVQPRDCRQKLKRDQFYVCLWFLLTSQWPFDHTSRFLSSNSAFFFSASCTFFASFFKSRKKTHQNTSKDIFGKKNGDLRDLYCLTLIFRRRLALRIHGRRRRRGVLLRFLPLLALVIWAQDQAHPTLESWVCSVCIYL